MPVFIRETSEIGGGPAGGAGQIHADPHEEFGGAEHTHDMSPLEIGIMVGVIMVFGTVIVSLFYYRARKIKKTQADEEAGGDHPARHDGGEVEDEGVTKGPVEAPSRPIRQFFVSRWLGTRYGKSFLGAEKSSRCRC